MVGSGPGGVDVRRGKGENEGTSGIRAKNHRKKQPQ